MSVVGELHRFVPATTNDAATLLVLHGTGGDENDLLPLAREVSSSAALLAPRGPVLENGMSRFFRRLAVGAFDLEDLRVRTGELREFVTTSAERYGFDPTRVFAIGYSNGANIASSLLLTDGAVLAGAILLRGTRPFVPTALSDLSGTPVLIAAGRGDPYAPAAEVELLAADLRESGARLDMVWSETGHALAAGDIAAAKSWFQREAG